MATNFSPCKVSYVLNQFPSNVMFGMNGFHVSASGAIQGHHGLLVFMVQSIKVLAIEGEIKYGSRLNLTRFIYLLLTLCPIFIYPASV